ncbi:MAG: hypothetical protein IEMM0008_0114 [bacterium]|nr:MAG: hypothetical protein IEMM0008_0114 [bacterium]
MNKKKVLFLCTGNSCRSQIAEGLARHYLGDHYDFYSAGIETHGLNPYAVKVMAEKGMDISNQQSKLVNALSDIDFDLVVTVCDDAHERCPIYLKQTKLIHKGFPDPAKVEGTVEEIMNAFRTTREQIMIFIKGELKITIKVIEKPLYKHIEYYIATHIHSEMWDVFDYFRSEESKNILPVLNQNDTPVGLIREKDLKNYAYSLYGAYLIKKKSITQFLSQCPIIDINTPMSELMDLLSTKNNPDGIAIITDQNKYIGILSANSLLKVIKEKIKHLVDQIESSKQSIEEIRLFISEVVQLISYQSSTITESLKMVEDISRPIQNIAKESEEKLKIVDTIENTSSSCKMEMKKSSEIMNKMTDSTNIMMKTTQVINDIARRTNMLAINAAIEASRAGKVGKGFRVVSGEIRKLSSEVDQNSKQITDSLNDVIKDMYISKDSSIKVKDLFLDTVSCTEKMVQSMIGIKSSIQDIYEKSKQIVTPLYSLSETSTKVKNSADEMDQKIEVIMESMKSLSHIAREFELVS